MIIIGVGGIGVTNTPGESLKTFALGSCVAVVMLHPPTRTVGMVHVALWSSETNRQKAVNQPGFFADTGIDALIGQMLQNGCSKERFRREVAIKIVGGANVMDPHNAFMIGKRNVEAIRQRLSAMGLRIVSSEVGDQISRTVTVHVNNGTVVLSTPGRKDWKL